MAAETLSLAEVKALLALMVEATVVPNTVLDRRYGISIDGRVRQRLNDLRLVETTRHGRGNAHALTDLGWRRCEEVLSVPRPKRELRGPGERILFAGLAQLGDYLRRSDRHLGDIFNASVERQIRNAYTAATKEPGAWVRLRDLRKNLGDDVDRGKVDDELRRMNLLPDVNLVPESIQDSLTTADHEAAVSIGDQDKHLISIGA